MPFNTLWTCICQVAAGTGPGPAIGSSDGHSEDMGTGAILSRLEWGRRCIREAGAPIVPKKHSDGAGPRSPWVQEMERPGTAANRHLCSNQLQPPPGNQAQAHSAHQGPGGRASSSSSVPSLTAHHSNEWQRAKGCLRNPSLQSQTSRETGPGVSRWQKQ